MENSKNMKKNKSIQCLLDYIHTKKLLMCSQIVGNDCIVSDLINFDKIETVDYETSHVLKKVEA